MMNNACKIVFSHFNTFVKCIRSQNWQWHSHYNVSSQHCAYHSCFHRGKSLTKIYFVCYQYIWHMWIVNPIPPGKPHYPYLACYKFCSREKGKWILHSRYCVTIPVLQQTAIQLLYNFIKQLILTLIFCYIGTLLNTATLNQPNVNPPSRYSESAQTL